jgi:hypothetical protein
MQFPGETGNVLLRFPQTRFWIVSGFADETPRTSQGVALLSPFDALEQASTFVPLVTRG